MSRGLFITLEGGEGAGKSTLIQSLAFHMQSRGFPFLLTREPGGSSLGERIRELLLETKDPIDSQTELLLFLAARSDHVKRVIAPALARGEIVLCDRFTHSTLAYQGFGRGLNLRELRSLCAFAAGGLTPDLTLYLDVPISVGRQRQKSRGGTDRMESAEASFHERVYEGFSELLKLGEMERIDATLSPESVAKKAWQRIESLL